LSNKNIFIDDVLNIEKYSPKNLIANINKNNENESLYRSDNNDKMNFSKKFIKNEKINNNF